MKVKMLSPTDRHTYLLTGGQEYYRNNLPVRKKYMFILMCRPNWLGVHVSTLSPPPKKNSPFQWFLRKPITDLLSHEKAGRYDLFLGTKVLYESLNKEVCNI